MKNQDFIKVVQEELLKEDLKISRDQINIVFKVILFSIKKVLLQGDKLELPGFCILQTKKVRRNNIGGEGYVSRWITTFKASRKFKEELNNATKGT